MKVKIKEANMWAIRDFSLLQDFGRIQGTKLMALDKLIQTKGEVIFADSDNELNEKKCLEFAPGQFIALEVEHFGESFFPCKTKIHHLQVL